MELRRQIPFALVVLRFALGPCFVVGYEFGAPGWLYVAILVVAIASDMLDGTLARLWDVVTPKMARWDSNADSVCFGLAALTAVLLRADYLAAWRWPIIGMFGFILAQNILNFIRYGRQPAYHMWSGKLWSIIFCLALCALFLGCTWGWAVDLLIAVSIYNSSENIIATLFLKRPVNDIPTVFHAIRIARQDGK